MEIKIIHYKSMLNSFTGCGRNGISNHSIHISDVTCKQCLKIFDKEKNLL